MDNTKFLEEMFRRIIQEQKSINAFLADIEENMETGSLLRHGFTKGLNIGFGALENLKELIYNQVIKNFTEELSNSPKRK